MGEGTTKEALLERVRRARAAWEDLVEEVGVARMDEPGPMGAWTFQDLLAHLTAWQQPELARLAWARGEEAPPAPWPAELDPHRDQDRINAFIHGRTRDLPPEAVLGAARRAWEELEAGLAALAEADLLDPGRYPWMEGEALGPAVVRSATGHYHDDHEADVRAWLADGPTA